MAGENRGPTICDLLSTPFGPFLDSMILSPECKTTPQKPVELKNVLLEHNGEPTGLTYSEWCQPEFDGNAGTGKPVRLRGLLFIKTLAWLSEEGRDLLTKALRRRDYNVRRKKHGSATKESTLALGSVFDKDGKLHNRRAYIQVVIQATKQGPAVYMNSELAPGALVIRTANHDRTYKVLGMDCETYTRSHLYLSRYRLLHDLRTIVTVCRNITGTHTSLADRTPEWFVAQYIAHLVNKDEHHIAPQADPDPSDESGIEAPYLPPHKQKKVRHISRAEVLGLFATHVDWLVKQQRETKFKKVFDPTEWGRFRAEAAKYRHKAKLENSRWGTFHGELNASGDMDTSESEDDMDVDQTTSRQPPPKKKKPLMTVSRRRGHPSQVHATTGKTTHPPPDETYENRYDSDFTTDGTSSADSDSDSLCSRSNSPSPWFAARIPPELSIPPKMPRNGPWICHVHGCLYCINFQELSEEQLGRLWPEDVEYIQSGKWGLDDPQIVGCFAILASAHFKDHLTRLGLAIVKKGHQYKLKSTMPTHGPFPSSRNIVVKEEAFSQNS
ncbi:hypothetical protein BC629DRAFT_1588658 [Irpex lacteus]|nr:hypothetical protein BC629DRAFT_1588658 [Irpex lacteus]